MAAIKVAQVLAQIVGLPLNIATDAGDAFIAAAGTLNAKVIKTAGNGGFITFEPFVEPETDVAPLIPVLTNPTSGALAATTYFVRVTYVNEEGAESLLSPEASQVCLINTLFATVGPAAQPGATAYKVYASNTAGGGSGAETLQATVPIGTTFQLPNTGLVAGAPMPNQLTGLVNGPCTITITQGAGSLTITTTA